MRRVAEDVPLVWDGGGALAFPTAYTAIMGQRKSRHVEVPRRGRSNPAPAPLFVLDPIDALKEGKARARAATHGFGPARRLEAAQAFSSRVVEWYWQKGRRAGDPPLRAAFARAERAALDRELLGTAETMGAAAARLDPVTAGYFISTTYAAMLPPGLRARLGAYYTPPALAARLLDQAAAAGVDWADASILDPACGGGAFLAPVAERMIKALSHLEPSEILRHVEERLHGFEIDAFAAWIAQVSLDAILLPQCRAARRNAPRCVEVADSLEREPGGDRYSLVIGNPPYGRVTLSPRLRGRYARSLYGHANLYGVFTDLALRWTRDDGVVAFVTPTSFLAGQYFRRLRALLASAAPPVSIDFITARRGVFDDVLQEALLATYRCQTSARPAPVHFVSPIDEVSLRVAAAGSFVLPLEPGAPWLLPRDRESDRLVARLRRMSHRLGDWGYSVSTGPLVWNRHKDQLRRTKTPGSLPLVWAEAVTSQGQFVFRALQRQHRPYFSPRRTDDWLIIRQPCVLLQRTTAKEQSRRLIAAALPAGFLREHGGAVVENHLNMIRPTVGAPPVPAVVLTAFLNSPIADRAFRCLNGSVAVSAYELEALPVPAPEAMREITRLIETGASRHEVEQACERLYLEVPRSS